MLDLHLESELESETATKWQRCGGCGGTNAHHATACEFCARILGRAHAAPATRRLHITTWWFPALLGLVLLSALIATLTETLAVK
jgi:hypothetical protein